MPTLSPVEVKFRYSRCTDLKYIIEFWQMYTLIWVYAYNPIPIIQLRYRTFSSSPEFHGVPLPSQLHPRSTPAATVLIAFTGLELLIHWIMIMDFFVWLYPSRCEIHVWDSLSLHAMCIKVQSSLLLTSSLYECTTIYFSIILLKVIWFLSSLGVLWIGLP